jgi:hypothetical protein
MFDKLSGWRGCSGIEPGLESGAAVCLSPRTPESRLQALEMEMAMKRTFTLLTFCLALFSFGCTQQSGGTAAFMDDEGEAEVALDQVPEAVMKAARAAVPGIVIEEAEREVENGVLVYELEGTANGKEYEIEVSADGKVLEIEEDDEDDDDDDDDDDDEDDDDDDD